MYLHPLPADLPPDIFRRTPIRDGTLHTREDNGVKGTLIPVLGVVVGVMIVGALILLYRHYQTRKEKKNKKPEHTQWLGANRRGTYQQADRNEGDDATPNQRTPNATNSSNDTRNGPNGVGGGIDRHASIRSVITLPAYRPKAGDSERVIGREGDRDGLDVVVDMVTAEEEEQMREDEMQALYEMRMARRQEIEEREGRRRDRREARARNDTVALQELQSRTRAASNNSVLEELRRDHDRYKNKRERAASSVSYGDLGVARADGSRLRANSAESERHGLLSDAASIAASSVRTGAASPSPSPVLRHHRAPSVTSVLSLDHDAILPVVDRSRASSRAGSSPEVVTMAAATSAGEGRGGEASTHGATQLQSPPGYDDVSLNDDDDAVRSSGSPPDYPGAGPSERRASRVAADMSDLAHDGRPRSSGSGPGRDRDESPRGGNGDSPRQLPALEVPLPRIVIEPSSARPTDDQ